MSAEKIKNELRKLEKILDKIFEIAKEEYGEDNLIMQGLGSIGIDIEEVWKIIDHSESVEIADVDRIID